MTDLLQKIQRQLDENHYVEAADIQALVDFARGRQWVSVEDDLPEAGGRGEYSKHVWIYTDTGLTGKAVYANEKWHYTNRNATYEQYGYKVTHWQPLPEGP